MWITNSWLIPYPQEQLGLPKGLIPLMSVIQPNKGKLCPVIDYRELNKHVDAFTVDADVSIAKLREWCQQAVNVALLDLWRTYLQVRVPELLWEFQKVLISGKGYCLRWLGFGLNVALLIMKFITKTVGDEDNIILYWWHICKWEHKVCKRN